MGNSSSSASTSPNTFMQDADEYRLNNSKLSDNDIKSYNISKSNYFKGTIAVCAIYGVFALFMLLIMMFSEKGSSFLSNEFQAFSLTFVGGLIFVIVLLVITIMTFKPTVLQPSLYDHDMCPDYWKLVPESYNVLAGISKSESDKLLMEYKCIPDADVWPDIARVSVANDLSLNKLFFTNNSGSNMNTIDSAFGYTQGNNNYLTCSNVYPNYVAMKSLQDKETNPNGVENLYACQYASACKIPWTSACP